MLQITKIQKKNERRKSQGKELTNVKRKKKTSMNHQHLIQIYKTKAEEHIIILALKEP